jgi:hypothetical protein
MRVSRQIDIEDLGVSKLRPARLCYKVWDHICNFYIYYHNYTSVWLTVIFARAALGSAHGNICGSLPKYLDALTLGFAPR